ncbi:hypothetical protein AB996_1456 [Lactococcus cremoris]|uniref:Uncharacterized protein n=1 Tax=Lactococcus lactis subsp. cremoris TaxID=1359 RepID=A0A166JI21_LACLC|nr:hypothetical protein AB996_1456 [Lactococcus cremoris]
MSGLMSFKSVNKGIISYLMIFLLSAVSIFYISHKSVSLI